MLPSNDRSVVAHHLDRARALADTASDEPLHAAVAAFDARMTLEGGDVAGDRALAIAAGERAAGLHLPDAECEALAVRADAELRAGNTRAAEESYARLAEAASAPPLVIWRIRALLGLGVIDRWTSGEVRHLADAREFAVAAGAVSLVAAIDLEMAHAHLALADLDRARPPLAESLDACRRYGLALLPEALAGAAMLHALSSDAPAVKAVAAEAAERLGAVPPGVVASGAAVLALVQGDDPGTLARLDEAAATANPGSGDWWLGLRLAVRDDSGPLGQVRVAAPAADPATRAYIAYSEAIANGRAGQIAEAEAAANPADTLTPPGWRHQHARRLVAAAAIEDSWGDPAGWAAEALEFFNTTALARVADACRATLRQAGVPLRRRGRGDSEVPPELYRLGVTSREIDVLRLLADRMTNREIGQRLFVSPRTVETHVANLRRKLGLDTRAELTGLGRRYRRGDDGR